MLSPKIEAALNEQLNAELQSAYLYLAMTAWFDNQGLSGFAGWMKAQFKEELEHAFRFYRYINDRGGKVSLGAITAPPDSWESPLAAFKAAYEHEVSISQRINRLVDLAAGENDHATGAFLQWFVTEQVEEEASVDAVVQKLKLIGDRPHALFMIDRELGRRASQ